jgi:hypothetical protein
MMFGQWRRVGRPPSKKRRKSEFWRGLCGVCFGRRVDGVCECGRNASQAVAGDEEEHIMLHVVYDGDDVAICSGDDAGMLLSYEESGVHRERSDVEEEDDNNDNGLEQELEGDLDV